MTKFKMMPPTNASWIQRFHHTEISVKNGIAETDNELTKIALRGVGFVRVIEKDEDTTKAKSNTVRLETAPSNDAVEADDVNDVEDDINMDVQLESEEDEDVPVQADDE